MIYLFNTNIIPGEAVVRCREIKPINAKLMCEFYSEGNGITSAIGHEATAAAMSAIIGKPVSVNRINAQPKEGDMAITLKINGRLPEGEVLNLEQLQEIGFSMYCMEFYGSDIPIGHIGDTPESVMAHEDPHSQYYGSARDKSSQ